MVEWEGRTPAARPIAPQTGREKCGAWRHARQLWYEVHPIGERRINAAAPAVPQNVTGPMQGRGEGLWKATEAIMRAAPSTRSAPPFAPATPNRAAAIWSWPTCSALDQIRNQLERTAPRAMIENLRGDHQLVGAGPGDERLDRRADPVRAADRRA